MIRPYVVVVDGVVVVVGITGVAADVCVAAIATLPAAHEEELVCNAA
jgi:hypothetical protein